MPWKPLPSNPVVPSRLPRLQGGQGTLGRPIKLFANFFEVTFSKEDKMLYHFDVVIEDIWQKRGENVDADPICPTSSAGATANLPVGAAPDSAEGGKKKSSRRARRKKAAANDDSEETAEAPEIPEPIPKPVPEPVPEPAAASDAGPAKGKIPRNKKHLIFREFTELAVFKNYPMAYDGEANAYSVGVPPQLKNTKFKHNVEFCEYGSDRKRKYAVTITLVKKASLLQLLQIVKRIDQNRISECATQFQMLEIMFNHQRTLDFEIVGRNKFFSTHGEFGSSYGVSGGKEGVVGFLSSLKPVAGWKDAGAIMLNIDTAHTAFYKSVMFLDFLKEIGVDFRGNMPLDDRQINVIMREIVRKNLRVITIHDQYHRKYKISSVSQNSAESHKFDFESGGKTKKINVVTYFRERYNYELKYTRLQCLLVGNHNSHMPMEVCKIAPNQRVKGKLSDRETAEFIKQTAVPPSKRLQQIHNIIRQNNFQNDPMLKKLGVQIPDLQALDITGRVLPVPQITMKDKTFDPFKGVWDTRDKKYYKAADFVNWVIVDFSGRVYPDQMNYFTETLIGMAKEKGMQADWPLATIKRRDDPKEVVHTLQELHQKYANLRLIVCIVGPGESYKVIKSTSDRELQIITQCIKQVNVAKCAPATIGNLLLKINAKLGGINFTSTYTEERGPTFSRLFNEPVMVMGADVNHPPASDMLTPSLVAVVASYNKSATEYMLAVRHQQTRVEIITDLEEITKSFLKQFKLKNNTPAKRIIMFRDGVSDSQFKEVLAKELRAIRNACSALHKDYKPSITFICVQKRHHTRFYVQNERDALDRNRNVPPGTVVDTVVTHRTEADFYLCSHIGIQGTSRPSHYHILWDDNDFTMNQMQLLTYSLCHNYSRCSRAVSIPTPAYYAHLAAFRAKVHLEGAQATDFSGWSGAAIRHDQTYPVEKLDKATRMDEAYTAMFDKLYYV